MLTVTFCLTSFMLCVAAWLLPEICPSAACIERRVGPLLSKNITCGIIMQMTFPGFPWTTSTRLYPEYGLSANPKNVPLNVQEAIVEALYA